MDESQLVLQSSRSMEAGSSTFSFAARIFPKTLRESAQLLYRWCRYCDDQIDRADSDESRLGRMDGLFLELDHLEKNLPVSEPFQSLSILIRRYQIPMAYPGELLLGMQMDVERRRYNDAADLDLYCYRVAGVVGLMMAYIMGVSDRRALDHAIDLGMAMQLTNIARDLREDAEQGRCYVPSQWMQELGLTEADLLNGSRRPAISALIKRLNAQSRLRYESGMQGLRYLPLSCALVIAIAACLYGEIGVLLCERGEDAWATRAIVSLRRKIWVAMGTLPRVLGLIPTRVLKPWRRVQLDPMGRLTG